MTKFWNFTNHPYENWGAEQQAQARLNGLVTEVPGGMPLVPPEFGGFQVQALAKGLAQHVKPGDLALVQGEASLCWYLTKILRDKDDYVFVATTEREVVEHVAEDGSVTKTSKFKFVKFRSLK